jgi:hypothetical protein
LTTLNLVGAFLIILAWGDLAYNLLLDKPARPAAGALCLAETWLFGCGLVSWGMFVCLWAGLSLSATVVALSLVGGLAWFGWPGRRLIRQVMNAGTGATIRLALHPRPQPAGYSNLGSPWSLVFGLIILAQIGSVAFAALVSPLTDWDAWVNWTSKANAVFIDQVLTPGLYSNPARLPTNMDYPLMLPLLEAWCYTWLGRIHEPAIGLISLLFYLTLLLLFYHAVRQLVAPQPALGFTALLATVPRLERMGHNGLADVPLATLVLLAFLLLFYDYNRNSGLNQRARTAALALAAGWLPWLKNEGWLWLLLVSLVWLGGLWQQNRSRSQVRSSVIVYSVIALVMAGAWPIFLAVNGTYRFTFLPLTVATLMTNLPRIPVITIAIAGRLLNPYWNFIWLFTGLVLLFRREKSGSAPVGWLVLPVVGFLLLAGTTYVFSRFDPYLAHVNNSIERLILQATPLALWWLVGQCVALGVIKGEPV